MMLKLFRKKNDKKFSRMFLRRCGSTRAQLKWCEKLNQLGNAQSETPSAFPIAIWTSTELESS